MAMESILRQLSESGGETAGGQALGFFVVAFSSLVSTFGKQLWRLAAISATGAICPMQSHNSLSYNLYPSEAAFAPSAPRST